MHDALEEHLGLARAGSKPFPHPTEKAYLLAPAGAEGPGFLMLQNFRVIMKYNPAEAYALAIGHFADRLAGGAPFVQPWPRQERELSSAERLELQQLLAQRGFYRGTPDGQFGGQTREALRSFQASIGAGSGASWMVNIGHCSTSAPCLISRRENCASWRVSRIRMRYPFSLSAMILL